MKPTKPKARVMWANYYPCRHHRFLATHDTKHLAEAGSGGQVEPIRVAVIPLIDLDELVVKAVGAYWTGENKRPDLTREESMRLALTSAGIPCTKRRVRK